MSNRRDKITVTVHGQDLKGWTSSTISRSMENLAATFDIPISVDISTDYPVDRQDDVVISINNHQVMAGYTLLADPFYDRNDAGFRVTGIDYTGSLVVSSAMHKTGQWLNATLKAICSDLCKPFGIQVLAEVHTGKPLARFELDQGETVADAMARAASYRGILITSNHLGQVLLTTAGKHKAGGSIHLSGVDRNVISMSPAGTDENRHSEYIIQGQSEINHIGSAKKAQQLEGRYKDFQIKRYKPLLIQADMSSEGADLQQQAEHMTRIRMAQAYRYTYAVEGWVTENGKPWQINTRVPIYDELLGLEGDEMLIVALTETVSRENADITEITICPPEAFKKLPLPEPKAKASKKKSGRKGNRKRDGHVPDWR